MIQHKGKHPKTVLQERASLAEVTGINPFYCFSIHFQIIILSLPWAGFTKQSSQ